MLIRKDGYECDECQEQITTEGFVSDEHQGWCSGHPDNEATVQHNDGMVVDIEKGR